MQKNKYCLSRRNAYATEYLAKKDTEKKTDWSKWGCIPLLIFAFIQGLPLNGEIKDRVVLFAEQIFEQTQASSTSLGFESSIVMSLILGVLYLFSVIVLVRSARRLAAVALLRFWPLPLQVLLMGISLMWVVYSGKVVLNIFHSLGIAAIALAAAIHFRQEPWRLLSALGFALGLNVVVHMLAVMLLPNVGIAIDGRWAGFYSHSNSFGAVAYCAVWVNVVAVSFANNLLRRAHYVLFLISLLALVGSGSATSIISAMVAVGGFYMLNSSYRKNVVVVAISAMLLVFMAFIHEMFTPSQTIYELVGKSSDLTGRVYIWVAGVDALLAHPFLGWGFDDNAAVNQVTGVAHSGYHNGYLDLAVRGGGVSFVLCMAVVVIGIRAILRSHTSVRPRTTTVFLPFIFSVLVYNLFEVSLFAPRNIMWVILLTVLFLAVITKVPLRIANCKPAGHH